MEIEYYVEHNPIRTKKTGIASGNHEVENYEEQRKVTYKNYLFKGEEYNEANN